MRHMFPSDNQYADTIDVRDRVHGANVRALATVRNGRVLDVHVIEPRVNGRNVAFVEECEYVITRKLRDPRVIQHMAAALQLQRNRGVRLT